MLYRGCLAKRLLLPSCAVTNANVTFHNPNVSNNVEQLDPSLWNVYLNEFDLFAHTTIVNDCCHNFLDADVNLDKMEHGFKSQKQHN